MLRATLCINISQVDRLELIMTLSSYNVNQQLINKFNQFLLLSPLFSTLKSYLTSKIPITEIHQQLVQEIHDIEENDNKNTETIQIRNITEHQIHRDREDKEREAREEVQQNSKIIELQNELALLNNQLFQTHANITLLQQIIATKPRIQINTTVPHHIHTHRSTVRNIHTHGSTTATIYSHHHNMFDDDVEKMKQLESQAQTIMLRIEAINNQLKEIQKKSLQLQVHAKEREARLQCRLDLAHQKPGVTLYDSLSASNAELLRQNIIAARQALRAKRQELIADAMQKNHQVFMQRLELSLNELKLSTSEIKALKNSIEFMKQHIEQVNAVNNIQSNLNQTNKEISTCRTRLQKWNVQTKNLEQANPYLIQQNEMLTRKNKELALAEQKNRTLRNKLITPTWSLAVISLFASIPLLLTFTGLLPIIMAPALIYTLLAILPAITLLASLGAGIAAIVFNKKMHHNLNEIENNLRTIRTNQEQMGNNDLKLLQLQQQTIPNCMSSIEEKSLKKTQLEDELKRAKESAQKLLEHAQAAEPAHDEPEHLLFKSGVKPPSITERPPEYSFFKPEGINTPKAFTNLAPSAPGGPLH